MYMRHPPPAHPVKFYQIAGLALACAATTAAADVHFEEDAFFEPLPVVLTASRLPQSLPDAPGAMTVLDRELIDATGYRDLPRLLRFVPGMHIGYERGNAHWVSYHGIGLSFPGEMQILIDGVSTYVPINFGTISWSALPLFLSEIERIEVVRGASANSLGSSALLGAVNLMTRSGSEEPGVSVRTHLGDPSIRDLEAGLTHNLPAGSFRLTAGEQTDSGFKGLHDQRWTQRVSLRADTQINVTDSIGIRLGSTRERSGRGYPDAPFDSNATRIDDNVSHLIHLRWRRTHDLDTESTLSLYHHQLDNHDAWLASGGGFSNIPLNRDRHDRRTSIEWQQRGRLNPATRWVAGTEASQAHTRSRASFATNDSIKENTYRVFGNLEWQARDKLSVNLGLATERHATAGWRISPRLYASYHASPEDIFRIGASRAWRKIAAFERAGDYRVTHPTTGMLLARPYMPNPGIRPSRADTVELGYMKQIPAGRSLLDLRLFSERLRDLVVRRVVPSPPPPAAVLESVIPTTRFENFGNDLFLHGVEVQLITHPWRDSTVRLAYSLIHRNANDAAVESGIAPYTAHLSWQQDWPARWSSMLSVTRVGPVASGDSFLANGRYVVDAFTTLDLTVSRRFSLGGHPARFTLAALNLGPRHQEIADPAMQLVYGTVPANTVSRQVYAGLDVRF
ncbi:MAG: TonB-dependent receptor [Rhodocyclaceae bacterium]|nr:TonB-dependent receptor [Rhodocyclaceae bacterium]